MTCPRCGNEWDVSRSPCSRCGLLVWLSGRTAPAVHTHTPPSKEAMQPDEMPLSSPHPFAANARQAPPSVRPSRLVTDSLNQAGQRPQGPPSQTPSFPVSPLRRSNQSRERRSLMAGTLLRSGRYRLHEAQARQEWSSGVYEMMWLALDAQRSGEPVMICELVIPDSISMMMPSCCEMATTAFTSMGRNPHVPMFRDAFSDQGRNFFVFELIEGESLLRRMRRTGRVLPEQEVIECCLQMTEVLELLSQQSPPWAHGQIQPEHIVERAGSQYVLTNFSIVLAGGAVQLVSGVDRSHLSPYTAPEFAQGVIDGRSDLYALLATAYHLVTGSVPTRVRGSIPQAQQLNPNVSPQLNTILLKGLHPAVRQRYQSPGELHQELLTIHRSGSLSAQRRSVTYREYSGQWIPGMTAPPSQTAADIAAQPLPGMLAPATGSREDQERRMLLPRPEELPPMSEGNDWLRAPSWLVGIVVCLLIVVVLGRGFF